MNPLIQQFLTNAGVIGTPAINLWIGIWALRRKFEWDHKLSNRAHSVRKIIVLTCWAIASIPREGIAIGTLRSIAFVVGLAFLWWPNCAYHFTRLFQLGNACDQGCRHYSHFAREQGNLTLLNLNR